VDETSIVIEKVSGGVHAILGESALLHVRHSPGGWRTSLTSASSGWRGDADQISTLSGTSLLNGRCWPEGLEEPVALAGKGRSAPRAAHRCWVAAAAGTAVGRLAGWRMAGSGGGCHRAAEPDQLHPAL